MKRLFMAIVFMAIPFALAGLAHASDDDAVLARLFAEAGVEGTFVLYDAEGDRYVVHHAARADTRHVPASTFKIPNSLVGLTTGAVANIDEVLPYGGRPQPFKAWERDMALREAIRVSNVPVYQELARRIGAERMRESLARLSYGNGEMGRTVDDFWLEGPLRISAREQARFLARFARGELPFPEPAQARVRELVLLESGDDWALHGKTGWATSESPPIGWWVGWVRRGERVYGFALNIDMPDSGMAAKRIEIGKACLRALGVL